MLCVSSLELARPPKISRAYRGQAHLRRIEILSVMFVWFSYLITTFYNEPGLTHAAHHSGVAMTPKYTQLLVRYADLCSMNNVKERQKI